MQHVKIFQVITQCVDLQQLMLLYHIDAHYLIENPTFTNFHWYKSDNIINFLH